MDTPRSPARRQGRPPTLPDARARILDEAAALFARQGYENSSVGDLAAALGVSKAALYHYFPTKQDIFDSIIVDVLQGLRDEVAAELAGAAGAHERLRRFMLAHARYFERRWAHFVTMLIGFSGMRTAYRADAARLRDDYEGLLREIVAQGIHEQSFRQVDVATAGRAVLSMLNWMARWYRPGAGDSAEAVAQRYFDLIVRGLASP